MVHGSDRPQDQSHNTPHHNRQEAGTLGDIQTPQGRRERGRDPPSIDNRQVQGILPGGQKTRKDAVREGQRQAHHDTAKNISRLHIRGGPVVNGARANNIIEATWSRIRRSMNTAHMENDLAGTAGNGPS